MWIMWPNIHPYTMSWKLIMTLVVDELQLGYQGYEVSFGNPPTSTSH
jgi:hypothetical protein